MVPWEASLIRYSLCARNPALGWSAAWGEAAIASVATVAGERTNRRFLRLLSAVRGIPVTKALFISLVFNLLLVAVNYLIALSIGVRVSVLYFLLFVPLISFSQLLPISLRGLGVREGAYVLLFGQAGVAAPLALAMSLTFYALEIAMGLIDNRLGKVASVLLRESIQGLGIAGSSLAVQRGP